MMAKRSLSKFGIAIIVVEAALLVACSRGGNVPKGWQGAKAVTEAITKIACKSPESLDVNMLNTNRFEKLSKSTSANGEVASALYAVRTILTKDVSTSEPSLDRPGVINIAELPALQTVAQHLSNEKNLVVQINDKNCDSLEATYSGPGVNQPVHGQIKGISHKGIRIEGVDVATGSTVVITVSIDRPGRKRGNAAAFNKYQEGLASGLYKMNIAIEQTMKSENGVRNMRLVEILQESMLNEDTDVEVHTSVLSPLFAELNKRGLLSPESQELLKAYNEAIESKKENVTMKFSKLMRLKAEAFDRQPELGLVGGGDGRDKNIPVPLLLLDSSPATAPPPVASPKVLEQPAVVQPADNGVANDDAAAASENEDDKEADEDEAPADEAPAPVTSSIVISV